MKREDFKKQMMKVVDRYVSEEVIRSEKDIAQTDMHQLTNDITRLEVIDSDGRSYSKRGCKIEFSVQDDGKTLKIFVEDK